MPLFLGVDCGGTSTRVVIADANYNVVGIGDAGGSNPQSSGPQQASTSIRSAVEMALTQARATHDDLTASFVGMAGITGKEDFAYGRTILNQAGLDEKKIPVGLDHDIRIALAGGLAGEEGLALIVGTGSSCYGRRQDGTNWKSGGWGSILDDGGSAYGLGHAAMRAAVRIADGRLPTSLLLEVVLKVLELSDIRAIVEKVHRTGLSKAEVAALAPHVIECWLAGDPVAKDLIQKQVEELTWIVRTTAKHLAFESPRVCYIGGLIEKSSAYRQMVIDNIAIHLPGFEMTAPVLPPVLGALLMAYPSAQGKRKLLEWRSLKKSYNAVVTGFSS